MKISNPFRYQFRQPARPRSSILKLWFGKRYYIVKAKSATAAVNAIAQDLDRRMRLGVSEEHIYFKVISYIKKARINMMEVEVLLESEDPLELLQFEHNALADGSYDPDCLNNTFEAYVPQWVPVQVVESFWRWKNPEVKNKTANNGATKNSKAVPAGRVGRGAGSVSNGKRRAAPAGSGKKNTGAI